ncbi:hypothetical protein [Pseudomonas phage vB_Pa-PAC2]|nr:hypothetical protein Deiofobo_0244 [Pseudomonas phage Deifobo]WPK39954.1 hypothetical protein ETTORE_0245 [Pseudomonas phage Ettore]WPK40474.1 hypothetical protein Paride_0244 [Pseudomonas phage Paride]
MKNLFPTGCIFNILVLSYHTDTIYAACYSDCRVIALNSYYTYYIPLND